MDYKTKYLKYKSKYLRLKGGSGADANRVPPPIRVQPQPRRQDVNQNIIIGVLNISPEEEQRRRQIIRDAPRNIDEFGRVRDPLNRPVRPPRPQIDPDAPPERAWAILNARDEDDPPANMLENRKQYLLRHMHNVNWDDIPPWWWPYNE
jgi:hypothetical protein